MKTEKHSIFFYLLFHKTLTEVKDQAVKQYLNPDCKKIRSQIKQAAAKLD